MGKLKQIRRILQGSSTWNTWREQHLQERINLSDANLSRVDLSEANLSGADLSRVDLSEADLICANFSKANLSYANLSGANISGADLSEANLSYANLSDTILNNAEISAANLYYCNLVNADLSEASLSASDLFRANLSGAILNQTNLSGASLLRTNLSGASLTCCSIYGISVWSIELEGAKQENLVITPEDEATITVDNLKIAQFIYLLLDNKEIRDVIDTVAKKAVLILGRFTPERKQILDALRDELRKQDYLPIMFDFEKPTSRNRTETIKTLAHLSRFVIADLTTPSSIPQELQAIVPNLAVPVKPILLAGKREYAMFIDFLNTYHWMLPVYFYQDQAHLLISLKENVIEPAEKKARELEKR